MIFSALSGDPSLMERVRMDASSSSWRMPMLPAMDDTTERRGNLVTVSSVSNHLLEKKLVFVTRILLPATRVVSLIFTLNFPSVPSPETFWMSTSESFFGVNEKDRYLSGVASRKDTVTGAPV